MNASQLMVTCWKNRLFIIPSIICLKWLSVFSFLFYIFIHTIYWCDISTRSRLVLPYLSWNELWVFFFFSWDFKTATSLTLLCITSFWLICDYLAVMVSSSLWQSESYSDFVPFWIWTGIGFFNTPSHVDWETSDSPPRGLWQTLHQHNSFSFPRPCFMRYLTVEKLFCRSWNRCIIKFSQCFLEKW